MIRHPLVYRPLAFLLLLSALDLNALAADTKKSSDSASSQAASGSSNRLPKNPDERFLAGRACLNRGDAPCAQVALAGINPASPYAKILDAQLATLRGDFDTALRLLIPLQTDPGLLPQAYASVHATLAQAYASQDNLLRTLEQYTLAEPFLEGPEAIKENQSQLWKLIADKPRELLVEIRGESPNPVIQGWIDLALAYSHTDQRDRYLEQWRATYPDHPASEELLHTISATTAPTANTTQVTGKIALLLPLDAPDYAAAAQAILAGFKTAHTVVGYQVDIQIYPTNGTPDSLIPVYQQAVQDGAQFVVGPLIRGEVEALAASDLVTVPTLALNQPENNEKLPAHLLTYGMAVETEAQQVAQEARHAGLQTVTVLTANTLLAKRMSKAFTEEWKAQDGGTLREIDLPTDDNLASLRSDLSTQPPDAIFLGMDARDAYRVRPYLDTAIPTFGISHIYDGETPNAQNAVSQDPGVSNQVLSAIHFVDMPWLIRPDSSEYTAYRHNADEFGKGWPQRWFALGADAYRLLAFLSVPPPQDKILLHGLSGNISLGKDGRFTRELLMGQFRAGGVALENRAP